jgi:NAD(P)-dependent dehydrogenase (short-subunit alcohol dehydrogenase family)
VNINLKHFALKALETAKEDLRRDKHLVPVAFVVTDNDVFDFTLDFEDAEQKASVYAGLVETAKQKGGRAIITINDANIRNPPRVGSEHYASGKVTPNEVQECIYLGVSGPSFRTWTICLPYERVGNEIVFGNPSETLDDILNLLPGWPTEQPRVS